MSRLTLGFIPLTDSAPLAVAEAKGLFAQEGLEVVLSREASWATVRDKVSVGALDGAHMLAPMALAATAGASGAPEPMLAPLALAVNGAGLTLSRRLVEALQGVAGTPSDVARALAELIRARAARGEPPLIFAVVFPFSIHNYALRYWLAQAGVDPDRDVRVVVVPPPRMVEQLRAGAVDGICVGAPWNAVAVGENLGQVVLRSWQFWPGGPDKVLGVSERFAGQNPVVLQSLLRALVRAQVWADASENRDELTALLARPCYVGAPAQTIASALNHKLAFFRGGASIPRLEHARWLLAQMRRWKQLDASLDDAGLAARVYRPDMAIEALRSLGMPADADSTLEPLFDGMAYDSG